jgi:hypothetical protein
MQRWVKVQVVSRCRDAKAQRCRCAKLRRCNGAK